MRLTRACVLVLTALVVGILGLQLANSGAAAATSVPWTDPAAVGELTLCGAAGQPLTSGSVDVKPFVATAVGSSAAPTGYRGTGRTATLFAFQPIQHIDPSEWNGEDLTGSGKYSNPAFPIAPGTRLDLPLSQFLSDYPPVWDGLVQLRMFVGAPLEPGYTATYNAAVLKIKGNTWTMVQGGKASCRSGTSVSDENILPQLRNPPKSAQSSSAVTHSTSGGVSSSTTSSLAASAAVAGDTANGASPVADVKRASSSNASLWWLAVLAGAAVVVLGLGGALLWRRRTTGHFT